MTEFLKRRIISGDVLWTALACVAIVVAIFILGSHAEDDRLCLRGHQEYRRSKTLLIIGKVFVPATTASKVWVCDVYEVSR